MKWLSYYSEIATSLRYNSFFCAGHPLSPMVFWIMILFITTTIYLYLGTQRNKFCKCREAHVKNRLQLPNGRSLHDIYVVSGALSSCSIQHQRARRKLTLRAYWEINLLQMVALQLVSKMTHFIIFQKCLPDLNIGLDFLWLTVFHYFRQWR